MSEKQTEAKTKPDFDTQSGRQAQGYLAAELTSGQLLPPMAQGLAIDPNRLSRQQFMYLQRSIGNRAVAQFVAHDRPERPQTPPRVRSQLRVGPADDRYEREADRIADHVMRQRLSTPPKQIQRHHGKSSHLDEEEAVQLKPLTDQITPLAQRSTDQHGRGCSCSGCVVQRQISLQAINAMPHEVIPQGVDAQVQRAAHGPGCSCGECSGLQLKREPVTNEGSAAKQIQRQSDIHGRGCSCGSCGHIQRTVTRCASREPDNAHDTKSASMDAPSIQVSSKEKPVIQRHSTHEHYLLGTLSADEISSLPMIREQVATAKSINKDEFVPEIQDQKTWAEVIHLIEQEMGRLLEWQKQKPEQQLEDQDETFGSKIGKVEKIDTKWQVPYVRIPTKNNTSVICTYGELNTLADMFGTIEDLGNSDPKVIVQMLQGVRQRVYIELYKIYDEIGANEYYSRSSVEKASKKAKKFRPDTSWSGAIGFSGKEKGILGSVGAVKQYEKATKVNGQFTASNASAALARNACHFAPETWYTWRRYHNKAREFARAAYAKRMQARMLRGDDYDERMDQWLVDNAASLAPNPFLLPDFKVDSTISNSFNPFEAPPQQKSWNPFDDEAEEQVESPPNWNPFDTPQPTGVTSVMDKQAPPLISYGQAIFQFSAPNYEEDEERASELEAEADELANKALLYSGFGDHYLQDAYASGHLIDKTKIMQWFILWHNAQGTKTWKDSPTFHMMVAIAEQELTSNPQMMENVQGGLDEKLNEVGIEVKDHILLLMWWRRKAMINKDFKSQTVMSALGEARKAGHPLLGQINQASDVQVLLEQLATMGFATKKVDNGVATYTLKDEHIKVLSKKPDKKAAYHAKMATGDFMSEAKEFYYVAYAKFLDSNYFQLITNYLHNIFCAQGLEVQTRAGGAIGRIYGDANMINAGGQDGVRHSAVTGEWAHEAIYDILDHGAAAHSTQDIEARFPARVKLSFGASNQRGTYLPIENWLAELKTECEKENGLFDDGINRFASTAMKRSGKTLTPDEQTITPLVELDLDPQTHDPIF